MLTGFMNCPRYVRLGSVHALSVAMVVGTGLQFAGCATDQANRYYLEDRYAAVEDSQVEVLRQPPTRPYVVMADFQARGASIARMRSDAAKIGADAVIVTLLGGSADQGQVWAGEDRFSQSYSRITGTAIKYK